jgi:alanine racemase
MNRETARTWAEIHMSRLDENYRQIRSKLSPGTGYLALVKANAYGHGAVPVARRYQELGAEYLAVACLEEGIQLREAGITTPILILGYTHPDFTRELIQYNITQTVYDLDMAKDFSRNALALGKQLRVHLKADTGMSRLGVLCDEAHLDEGAETLAQMAQLPGLDAEGLFMHFAVADSDGEEQVAYSQRQIARYEAVSAKLTAAGITIPIHHCAASAALLNYPQAHHELVRPGIIQYGIHPDPSTRDKLDIKPVMEVKSRVASVKELPQGTTISYGRTYTLERDSRVAVVPMGYGDGLFRLLSNRQQFLLHGQRVNQIGRVCMDMCMVDVTDLPQVQVGDVVTVFGDGLPLEEKADMVGTIPYELLCAVGERVPRIYVD